MKKILSIVLIALIITSVLPMQMFNYTASAASGNTTEFAGGSGTEDDPYLIETKEHLNNVRNYLDAHYKMISNIVFTDADFEGGGEFYNDGLGWEPIGTNRNDAFDGSFDGNNHIVSGLQISFSGATLEYLGLFGYNKGLIKNIGLINSTIEASSKAVSLYVGGIVGYNFSGTIGGCFSDAVISSNYYCGGIAGDNSAWGTIKECYSESEVSSEISAGGIVSYNWGDVLDCYNIGNVSGDLYAGGIVGKNNGYINNCYNFGRIDTPSYSYCGGIAGNNDDIITNSYYFERESRGSGRGVDIATKCSLEQLKNQNTFTSYDFESVWEIGNTLNYPLPTLKQTKHKVAQENTVDFAGGSGTLWDPYLIETTRQLNNVRNYLYSHFLLTSNISISKNDFSENGDFYNDGKGWEPIGTDSKPFRGSFDGNGYSISGITISANIKNNIYFGLFGNSIGEIKNLTIEQSAISVTGNLKTSSSSYDHAYVGHIVGKGNATNCNSIGVVSVTYESISRYCYIYVGGIAGSGNSTNCSTSGEINIYSLNPSKTIEIYAGGITGSGTANSCSNTCKITANTPSDDSSSIYCYIGGIAGRGSNIFDCNNAGTINARTESPYSYMKIGGIAGFASTVEQCYNIGFITVPRYAYTGGIVGALGSGGKILDSFNAGTIMSYSGSALTGVYIGGIVGLSQDDTNIKNCYNVGFISTGYGISYKGGTILNCYSLENNPLINNASFSYSKEEMMLQKTFIGFDFDTIWQIGNNSNYPWPELQTGSVHNNMIDISDCTIALAPTKVSYHDIQPDFTVSYNGEALTINKDYIAFFIVGNESWRVQTTTKQYIHDVGIGKLLIIGNGDFCYTTTYEFNIEKYDISNSSGNYWYVQDVEYDGKEKKQSKFRVSDKYGIISSSNYEITYKNNIKIGTATMIVTGKGDYYTGKLEIKFTIHPRSISSIKVTKKPSKLTYHKGKGPIIVSGGQITVYYQDGGKEKINMTASMLDGNYSLSMIGKQNIWLKYNDYSTYYEVEVVDHTYKTTTTKATLTKNGSVVKKCTVCSKVASNTAIEYAKTFKLSATSYTYNGAVKTPTVTVKDSAGKTLKKNTDYTVTYATGRKNVGTYKVTIKMIGKYSGTKTLTFKINPAKISSYKLSATTYTYDGKVKKPTVTVKNNSGTKLSTASYTVTYASGRKNVGTYKVTIKGKGNYTGTKTLTFKINPVKTTISKLTPGKKSIKVTVGKKTSQVTGYQIQYATNKSFKSAKTKNITSYKTTSTILTKLTSKKTYYVRVRTYKTVKGVKYYSGWSTYKSAKAK